MTINKPFFRALGVVYLVVGATQFSNALRLPHPNNLIIALSCIGVCLCGVGLVWL